MKTSQGMSLNSEVTNYVLTKEVDEDEIQKVIWSVQLDKTLGPDGFSISSYHSFGSSLKRTF